MASVRKLWERGKAIPWAVLWEVGRSLWSNAGDRVNKNLSAREREDSPTSCERDGAVPGTWMRGSALGSWLLVKKAATGERDSDWREVGFSVTTLLPPRLASEVWKRLPRG